MARRREMDVTAVQSISIEQLSEAGEWRDTLAQSVNGTLFHDLNFLGYHPPTRFRFHHLVFRRNGKVIALLPGGLTGDADRPTFSSPVGASVGGFAVVANLRAEVTIDLVEALQKYASTHGWAGVEITLPPACYSFEAADQIAFALFYRGFRVSRRWLSHMLPVVPGAAPEKSFRENQLYAVRAARREGMVGIKAGLEGLDRFLGVFRDTYDRHGVAATHAPDEIRDLMRRFPDRIWIQLAMKGDEPVAGLLVFQLTATIANTFYICTSAEHAKAGGAVFAIADLIGRLSSVGNRYVDFGPSANDQNFHKGVTFFKEGLGASGQCRDRWNWQLT
jgi:hypothetical protein